MSFVSVNAYDLVISLEDKAGKLYRKFADIVVDEKLVKLFKTLAAAEDKHKLDFSEMRDLFQEENSEELKKLVEKGKKKIEDKVFNPENIKRKVKGVDLEDVLSIFDFAISLEHDAIELYTSLMPYFREGCRGEVAKILNVEKNHMTTLLKTKGAYANMLHNEK